MSIGAASSRDPRKLQLALRGSGQALYVGIAEDTFVVASEPYGVIEECDRYLRMDGETPGNPQNPTASRGQVIELDGSAAGEIAGIRRAAYDGTPLPVVEKKVVIDLLPALRAGGGWTSDKPEGFAVLGDRGSWVFTGDTAPNPALWQRDLSSKVKQATAALLLQEAAEKTVRAGQEAAAVMAAAALTRDVILGHRADTKAARGLMARLLGELEACTLRPDALAALLEKAGQDLDAAGRLALRAQVAQLAQLHNRVGSMRQLADTLGKLHTAERKAFGIQDDEGGSDPLDNATEAELEAELAALEAQTAAPGLRLVG